MDQKTKVMLKKIFPLGFLVTVSKIQSTFTNKMGYFGFLKEWGRFKSEAEQVDDKRFNLSSKDLYPILYEKDKDQAFDRHYVYHLAWAARKVREINPERHVDISSSLHFSTIVSAFIPVDFYDYRPADIKLANLNTGSADLTKLHFADNSIKSLSCMHTIEHVGLGRYGDPIDPKGDIKSMNELIRVLAPGGDLIFVAPVGRPKVMFNSSRVYSFEQVLALAKGLNLKEFTLLPDAGGLIENATPEQVSQQTHGCGCFWFKKI
jgi:hypothetical protein